MSTSTAKRNIGGEWQEWRAGTALAVAAWRPGEAPSPHQTRARREHLRRTYLRSSRAEMQSLGELLGIPEGTQVVAHLFRGAHNASPDLKRRIALGLGLGPQVNLGHGVRHRVRVGNVGSIMGPFPWRADLASPAWQSITRYVFFDAGDEVLEAIDRRSHLTIERFETSDQLPAAVVTPRGWAGAVHFESQDDGFGLTWPTRLSANTALGRVLSLLPAADAHDRAAITSATGSITECAAGELMTRLAQVPDPVVVELELGDALVVWGSSQHGPASVQAQMGFGAHRYRRGLVRDLLQATGDLPEGWRLEQIVDVADEVLGTSSR